MHIVDVTWKRNEEQFIPGLSYWDENKNLSHFRLLPGTDIAWTITGPRMCIGRRDDYRIFRPCPFDSLVVKQSKCNECREMDGFDPCIRCTGSICHASPYRYRECQSSPYVVYLAYFSDGSTKVGVSSLERVRTRWVEQGADYAAIVATVTGGDRARKLEHRLGKSRDLRMTVSGASKISSILTSFSLEEVESMFFELLASTGCDQCLERIEVDDLTPHYRLQSLDAEPLPWPDTSKPLVGQQVLGRVLGMKGSLLVTYIGHAYRILSLRKLLGYTIKTSIDEPVISQTGLLDFI